MKILNPQGIPWDEYLVTHLREILSLLVVVILLLSALSFVERPGAAVVSGRVSSQGKPVVFGTVTVLASDNRIYSVPIRADGTYLLRHVPPGAVRVAVSSPQPQSVEQQGDGAAVNVSRSGRPSRDPPSNPGRGSRMSGRSAGKAAEVEVMEGVSIAAPSPRPQPPRSPGRPDPQQSGWFRIPGRYANPATSGIVKEIQMGRTTLDLSLD